MDANEYALQVKPATKSLGVAIRSAIWLGKGKDKPVTTKTVAAESIPVESESLAPELDTTSESEPKDTSLPSLAAKRKIDPPLPATPVPPAPNPIIDAEIKTLGDREEFIVQRGERRYRIRGLDKNMNDDLKQLHAKIGQQALEIDFLEGALSKAIWLSEKR